MGASLDARFAAAMVPMVRRAQDRGKAASLALALSGGGDSIALMLLLKAWAEEQGLGLLPALIVDHGLRPEASAEARETAQQAKAAGCIPHVLRWRGAKPDANVEGTARTARYRLMGDWCRGRGVTALAVAHTRDDQAETFLLRLGRGSGLDGLAAMRPRAPFPLAGYPELELVRPLLDVGREELRAFLKARKAKWIEDPMNEDGRFFRVRVRALLPALAAAGIPKERIAAAASHLARAQDALKTATEAVLAAHARRDPSGFALVDPHALRAAPREIGLRAFAHLLMAISGEAYRPRLEALERAFDAFTSSVSPARTLHGCKIARAPKELREFGPETLLVEREKPRKRVPARLPPHKNRILRQDGRS